MQLSGHIIIFITLLILLDFLVISTDFFNASNNILLCIKYHVLHKIYLFIANSTYVFYGQKFYFGLTYTVFAATTKFKNNFVITLAS